MAKEIYRKLMKSLSEGRFTCTGELEPLKTTSLEEVIEGAKILKDYVVSINITDNLTAFAYMNPLVPAYFIQEKVGLEAVYQMTVRDRNRLALLSDLLAAGALGIKNVLALTGDHITVGDNPQAKPVFDLDSATFIYMLRRIVDEGLDLNNNKIDHPPRFNIGVAANPNANPLEPELLKIERKVRLGADFIQTQAVYDIEVAKRFMKETSNLKTPTLIGVVPFRSVGMMDWMIKFVPGISVPNMIQERLRQTREKGGKDAFYQENINIFSELIKDIRKTTNASDVHLMAIGFEWIIPKIIERAGIN